MTITSILQYRNAGLLFILLALALPAAETQAQNTGPQAGMATRTVTKYLALERGLLEAIAQQNREAVIRILIADFEFRSPDSQDPQALDDWISKEFSHAQANSQIRDLSTFETDDIAVVSFTLDSQSGTGKAKKAASYFVVDVWRISSDKLLVRYLNKPARQTRRPVRPDGRE